jgi:hypothetical protein
VSSPDDPSPTITNHELGSIHWANKGCGHRECLAARAEQKRKDRENRRGKRILRDCELPDGTIEKRWVHPDLAPSNQLDNPARHGTRNARSEYFCDCPECEVARSKSKPTSEDT